MKFDKINECLEVAGMNDGPFDWHYTDNEPSEGIGPKESPRVNRELEAARRDKKGLTNLLRGGCLE
jgi:hypothetical protein